MTKTATVCFNVFSGHQRKLQLQQEIARKKAIKEEEERFLREADTGERFGWFYNKKKRKEHDFQQEEMSIKNCVVSFLTEFS